MALAALRYALHLPVHSPYRLADMAQDAVAVLDALGIAQAHVCGASMGGMIAQHLAAQAPQRVASLTLMMTTSGARALPGLPGPCNARFCHAPGARAPAQRWTGSCTCCAPSAARATRLISGPAGPCPRIRAARLAPGGSARQLLAIVADGDRTPLLQRITAPTRIVHGMADPLVPPGLRPASGTAHCPRRNRLHSRHGARPADALLERFAQGIAQCRPRAQRALRTLARLKSSCWGRSDDGVKRDTSSAWRSRW